MIGIQLDGDNEFLETGLDTTIQIRLQNPLLGDADKLSPGSFSFPFDIPSSEISPTNATKLKNPDVIENNEAYIIQKAKIFFDGVPFKQGTLKAQIADRKKTSCYFAFGLNSISPDFKNAKLRDVLNEEIVISTRDITKTIYIKAIQSITTMDFSVNEKSYNGTLDEIETAINADALGQIDTDKFVPKAEKIIAGTSPSGLITAPFLKIYLVKVASVSGGGVSYTNSLDPLDVLSLKINPIEVTLVESLSQHAKSVNENDYLIESFDMTNYYDDFDTFFDGYITGVYPTDKFRMPALLNEDPYGELGILTKSPTSSTTSGIIKKQGTKNGNLNNGVNATGLVRNTFNTIIDFLLTVPSWDNITAFTRFHSCVKHADTNGDERYWWCLSTGSGHEPPTDPIHTFNDFWVQYSLQYELKNNNYNSLQPFLRRKWILEKIAATFGFSMEGDFYDHPDLTNMLEYTSTSLDSLQDYIADKKFAFWRRGFNLNELVPDITVVEYLKRLQGRYNFGIYYNESSKKVRLKNRESVIKSYVYDDVTPMASPLNSIEDQRVTGYSIICPKDDTDQYSELDNLIVGIPQEDITMQIGGITRTGVQIVDGNYVNAPLVKQNFGAQYLMKTIYYKGLNTSGSFDYPSGDIMGLSIKETLTAIDSTGIYDQFFRYWLNAKKNWRLVKINVSFPFRMIINFDWELKRRYDRSNFIVSAIDVRMNNTKVQVSSVELLTTL